MTNDYAALVAMLDQAAADLQAEIDAAIDRHGLLVRTANQLRAEADGPNVAAEPVAILSVHERCTQEQRDALKQRLASDNRWQYVIDPANTSERERRAMRSAIIGYVRPPRWTGGPDAQRTPSPPRACTWPGCEFVSSPSGTGSHMAAHRRRTDGAA